MTSPKEKVDPFLYRLMAETVQDYGIFLLDPLGNVMTWNPGAQRIKGYEASEIIGKHFSVFYPPVDIARKWPQFELETAKTIGRFEDEGWRIRKDGSTFWANIVITALRDESGKLLAFSKITRDLSERKKQEEALRGSEERFRLLVEGVADYAIYMLDPDGRVTSWNQGARRIKGYEATEIIGQHFSRFYDTAGIEAGKPELELTMAREHGRAEDEGWRVRKDGSRFWASVVVTALYDETGKLRGFAKVTQDMTQRMQSEALAATAKKISDFIAVLAHELRNPLAPIRNAVHLMDMAPPGDPIHEKTRRIIDRQTAQLSRIVDDLLDISRITRGTLEIRPVRVAVGDIVRRAVEAARPGIDMGRHDLVVDLPAEPVYVLADEIRLTQALTNILNNAARYTDPGGSIVLRVFTAVTPASSVACIAVRDNGRGIESSMQGAIFGMFVQGRNAINRIGTGLGIGLALTRSIVELHHGSIEVESAGAGKGSEFTMRLPLDQSPPDRSAAIASTKAEVGTPPPMRKLRLLVVDDNVDAADILSGLLGTYGHTVKSVNDGVAALAALDAFQPDVVLLDIGMPGMTGFEVARRIRERHDARPPMLVAVTGWGAAEDREKSRAAGFDLHLVKPIDEGQLLRLLAISPAA